MSRIKIIEAYPLQAYDKVQLKFCGNVISLRHMSFRPKVHIQRISRDHYVIKATGELREYQHSMTRADNIPNVKKSLAKLRDLLNTNATDSSKTRWWLTLTFRRPVSDPMELYNEFRRFILRLRYYFKKCSLPNFEYIVAAEPSQNHGFHLHVVLIFKDTAPYISNILLAKVWGNGFVNVKNLVNITNVGLYISAILSNTNETEEMPEGKGNVVPSGVCKGGRLSLYPPGMRIFRRSKGILDPVVCKCTCQQAMQEIGNSKAVFERAIEVVDDNGKIVNRILYRQFDRTQKEGG